jgi:hypothetical protein
VVRCGLAEGKAQEGFEGEPVVDLVFQFGIRLDAEPLFKQQALEEHQGRAGAGALLAGAHGVMAEQDGFYGAQLMVLLSWSMSLMERFCSRQLATARSARSMLREVFLNPMLISGVEVIETSGK